jgi:predicted dehydrogenase
MTVESRVKLALIGLGRLGTIRARILAFQQPRIELVAVCDTKPGTGKWAAENLPASVKHFSDPQDCMRNSGAQAILICTATATHAALILQAFDLDLHVMCEKPVSVDVITTAEVVEKAASKPELKFLVPFTRRCKLSSNPVQFFLDCQGLTRAR